MWRCHHVSGYTARSLYSRKVFCDVQKEHSVFHFVPTASGLVTEHHWKELVSLSFALSFHVFIHVEKIPLNLLFSILNKPRSFSVPLRRDVPVSLSS